LGIGADDLRERLVDVDLGRAVLRDLVEARLRRIAALARAAHVRALDLRDRARDGRLPRGGLGRAAAREAPADDGLAGGARGCLGVRVVVLADAPMRLLVLDEIAARVTRQPDLDLQVRDDRQRID